MPKKTNKRITSVTGNFHIVGENRVEVIDLWTSRYEPKWERVTKKPSPYLLKKPIGT